MKRLAVDEDPVEVKENGLDGGERRGHSLFWQTAQLARREWETRHVARNRDTARLEAMRHVEY